MIKNVYGKEIKGCEFAGFFYPKDKEELNKLLDEYFNIKEVFDIKGEILGIISPHAGYIYSGKVSAYSYKILENRKFDTILILGPSHHYLFKGLSIYPNGYFDTPFGMLEVDEDIAKEFKELDFVNYEKRYFNKEHCLEVQLPFIIKSLGEVKIVPILFGDVNFVELERFVKKIIDISKNKKILIIVSTDLSHYHPYKDAVAIDTETIEFIKNKDFSLLWEKQNEYGGRACGIRPLTAFVLYSKKQGATIDILKYANSGDTAGPKTEVVGYVSAVALRDNYDENLLKGRKIMDDFDLNNEEKKLLLEIARKTLESYLKDKSIPDFKIESPRLKENRGVFVTLKKKGELRGCIGRIVADTPLYKAVSQMAIESALNDPRFPSVEFRELKDIEIEISVLTPFSEVKNIEEIEVGKHGLMIVKGFYSGLLLPQVPLEYGWDRTTFLEHTCLKAGLKPTAYKDEGVILYKFSAIVFNESDFSK